MVVQSLPVRSWKLVWMIHFEQLFWGYSHHLGCGFTWNGWENGSLYPSSTRQFKWKSITLEQETVIGISLGRTRFKNTAGKKQGRIPGMGNGGKWRKSCGQYPKSHLALSHRCLQRLKRNSAKPGPMKLKLQQGRREALLMFSHMEAEGSAPKRGLGFFVTAWEGWRRKGEHRSDIRALKDNQRRFLSKERSQMFCKMG